MAKETTTKFKVDISELKSGIQEAQRQIRIANSEFKAATAGMDDWSKSADGLSAKLTQLNSVLESEKKKLSNLEQQYALVAKEQGETSKGAQELLIKINNQKAAIGKVESELKKYSAQLENVADSNDEVIDASEKLRREIESQEKALEDLKREYSNVALEQGKESNAAKKLESKIESLNTSLKDNKKKLSDASYAVEDAGNSAEKSAGGWTIVKDVIADLAKEAITWAIEQFKQLAVEGETALDKLQAKVGATSEKMEEYSDVVNNLYKGNFGESITDISESLGTVIQMTDDLDKKSLQNVTENALTLRDVYGYDITESMRAVNSLTKQFGISSDEAFNLIVQGAQNGLDQNGDLLDTINEYSVQFNNAGYSANDMFNMLVNGTENGTWSVDKLGDAIKEMNIRSSDGTIGKALSDYRKSLGLTKNEVDDLSKRLGKGGESAEQAMSEIMDSLSNVSDETELYNIGVAMFGTMWEDLGDEAVSALLRTGGQIDATNDAMSQVKTDAYDNLASSVNTLGRTLKTELLQPIVNAIAPVLTDFFNWMNEHMTILKPIIIGLATAFTVLAGALAISGIISGVQKAMALLNTTLLANPITLVVAAIAALVAVFIYLWNNCEEFRNFWIGLWEGIKTACSNAVEGIKSFFGGLWDGIKNTWNGAKEWFSNLWASIKATAVAFITPIIDFFTGIWEKIKAIYTPVISFYVKIFTSIWNTLKSIVDVIITLLKGCWTIIKTVYGIAWNWFKTTIINPIKNGFSEMWNSISTVAKTTWNKITSVFKVAASWFKGKIIDPVSNFFGGMWDKLKSGARAAWEGIKSVFSKVATFFKNIFSDAWAKVKAVFSTGGAIFSGIKDGIVSAFKKIVNSIIRGINKVVSVPFNAINKALDKIRSISIVGLQPFKGLGSISIPKIPELEKGGVLKKGQIGFLEGNGAEAVVPLEKNTGWLDEIAKRIYEQFDFARGLNLSNGTRPINNTYHYNFYQTNNSPKSLSRLDIYRQSKNLLSMKGV